MLIIVNLFHFLRDVTTPEASKAEDTPSKSKSEQTETKTVKKVLSYVPFQAAFEVDSSQLSARSWKKVQSHFVMMKSMSKISLDLFIIPFEIIIFLFNFKLF